MDDKFKILVTTSLMWGSTGVAVHTESISFNTPGEAMHAVALINGNSQVTASLKQEALALF